jgi:hypothetical protein
MKWYIMVHILYYTCDISHYHSMFYFPTPIIIIYCIFFFQQAEMKNESLLSFHEQFKYMKEASQ